jgi:hypothetical protein
MLEGGGDEGAQGRGWLARFAEAARINADECE